MDLATVIAMITELSKVVTALVGQHEKALAAKDKEIADLKKVVADMKPAPK